MPDVNDIESTCNCSDIVVGPGGDLGGYMGHKHMCAVSVEYRKGNKEFLDTHLENYLEVCREVVASHTNSELLQAGIETLARKRMKQL